MEHPPIKPGVPVSLQELQPPSVMLQHGASIRVVGKLESYDVETAIATVRDGGVDFRIDTQHLRGINFRVSSIYQFIGELLIQPGNEAKLQARVGRNVDGIDLNLYHQALLLQRKFISDLQNSGSC